MGEIVTAVATTNDVSDDQVFYNLLYQIRTMICHFYKLDLLLDGA